MMARTENETHFKNLSMIYLLAKIISKDELILLSFK